MDELLRSLLYIVETAVLPVVITYVVKFVRVKIEEIKTNMNDQKVASLIHYVTNVITLIVEEVNQTFVETLKKNGEFTIEAQTMAKTMAVERAEELISLEAKEAIKAVYGNIDSYLDSLIESTVHNKKIEV